MTAPPPSSARSLTIDRARHANLVRDAMFQLITSPRGSRRLGVFATVAVVVGLLGVRWLLGVGLAAAAVLIQLVVWRIRLGRSMKCGLGVGQSVTVAYADSGELTVIDVTGQIWLPRGSALIVLRKAGNVTVFGRASSFFLPGELLTDADIAFLEGHGDAPEEPSAPGPPLPLSLEVTPGLQSQLVAGATRVLVTSADFWMLYLAAAILIGFAALTGSWPFVAWTTAFYLGCAIPSLRWLARSRRQARLLYPVGRTIRAEVTAEHLALSTPHRTLLVPWSAYHAHRLTPQTVLLQRNRRRPQTTQVLPRALFTKAALTELTTAVPRRF